MIEEKTIEQLSAEFDELEKTENQRKAETYKPIIDEHKGLTAREASFLLAGEVIETDSVGLAIRALGEVDNPTKELHAAVLRAAHARGRHRLKPINPNEPENEWRFKVAELVHWAEWSKTGTTKLARLLTDRDQIAKVEAKSKTPHARAEQFSNEREQVLGAAVCVMANMPGACQNGKGKVEAAKVANQIEIKQEFLFETEQAPMNTASMAKIISPWIKRLE